MSSYQAEARRDPMPAILLISAGLTAFLVWWIYFKTTAVATAGWVAHLPALNATFNTLAAVCLVAGFRAIRQKRKEAHLRWMLSALTFSALFLVSYLLYHHYHGDTRFTGQGFIRPVYFFILISHVLLSIVMLPMILSTLFFSANKKFASHKKIARWTLPIWLYVSVTGVVIFFFLKLLNPG
ncbi:MAG: DUF420 domain-containing protein [Acidobacteriota bacterium]